MIYSIEADSWKNPTADVVHFYAHAFDLCYGKEDESIFASFEEMPGSYKSNHLVERRIHLINGLYHTMVPVDAMLESILGIENLDDMIKVGDSGVVDRIADTKKGYHFVFATKYCCFANRKKYPIFDSLSSAALECFNEDGKFYKGRIGIEKFKGNYGRYRGLVNAFMSAYGLKFGEEEIQNFKELDEFLWLVGKNL